MFNEVFQTDVNNLSEEYQDVLYNAELESYSLHKESLRKTNLNENRL